MNASDLMNPRWKVQIKYPKMLFAVGEIITEDDFNFWNRLDNEESIADFPDVFQRLEWWQERKPEEMPEYVKDTFGRVVKAKYQTIAGQLLIYDIADDEFPYKWTHIVPATLEEYQSFIDSLK